GPALFGVADTELEGAARAVFDVGLGPLVFAASYGGAVALVRPIGRGRFVVGALAAGFVAFLPICLARLFRDFPGINLMAVAWLAFFCLAVPAALAQRRGFVPARRPRARRGAARQGPRHEGDDRSLRLREHRQRPGRGADRPRLCLAPCARQRDDT